MYNSVFKILCFKNGLYSPKQVIEYYKLVYGNDIKYTERDAQLWMNGKNQSVYIIDSTAIDLIESLCCERSKIVDKEYENLKNGLQIKFKFMFKNELNLWNIYPEFMHKPINFYNSILIELNQTSLNYYENIKSFSL